MRPAPFRRRTRGIRGIRGITGVAFLTTAALTASACGASGSITPKKGAARVAPSDNAALCSALVALPQDLEAYAASAPKDERAGLGAIATVRDLMLEGVTVDGEPQTSTQDPPPNVGTVRAALSRWVSSLSSACRRTCSGTPTSCSRSTRTWWPYWPRCWCSTEWR